MKELHKKAPAPRSPRMIKPDGGFNVIRKGISKSYWRDLYHFLHTVSWPKFLVVISLAYILANSLFALAYTIGGGIENARRGNFLDAFFFSVQTMASIGYGAMYPKSLYANLLVTVEALLGLLWIAMATGLMFARFSIPKARVIFSRVAVIAPYNNVPTLIFRVANERQNWILEAQIHVTLVRNEISQEGDLMRRFYNLSLVRSHSPLFALSWTVMHVINKDSPLYGVTPEEMVEDEMELIVTLTGLDETVAQTIHARHSFIPEEIFWNMRFVDILSKTRDGKRSIDYTRFHDIREITD